MLPRQIYVLLCGFLLPIFSLVACFSGNQSSTTTAVSGESPTPQLSQESATVAPTDTPPPTPTAVSVAGPARMSVVEDASAIHSYRMRIEIQSEDARGQNQVGVEGAFVKAPPAEQLVIHFEERGEPKTIEMVTVNGVRYLQAQGMWMQAPGSGLNINEYTLITTADVAERSTGLIRVGEETVNGRATIHYRGDKHSIPVAGTPSDKFDVSRAEMAEMDLWVDQAEQFIVKMQITVQDGQAENRQSHVMLIEYFDFNQPITIGAPENLITGQPASEDNEQPAAASEPRTDLGKLLGFDLLLPTGSQITLSAGNMVQAATPYTLEEAANLFQQQMPRNGYTLMSQITPEAGQTMLMFQKGAKIVTINLTALSPNETRMDVVSAP
jgi:hypothetical protein